MIKLISSGIKINSKNSFEKILDKKKKNKYLDIVFIGRIEKDKGIIYVLESFSNLSKKYKKLRLHVFGKGSRLKELSKKYKQKSIIFHGFSNRNKIEKILEKAHIFCMPSLSESFGNSVIEAMMFGVVPIFSKGKTAPNLFDENLHGLKIKLNSNKDNPINIRNLIKKIELLINNKKQLYTFSQKAYNFSRFSYSIEKMTEKTMVLYEEILK